MTDFVERLIRREPEKYGRDGIHKFQNNKFIVIFSKEENSFEIIEFTRF